jgi:predicted ArsR family transcriptional regulator
MTRRAASDCATAPSTLSQQYTGLVCGMNVEIMQTMVEELGLERFKARLEPQPGMCSVAFRRT